MLNSNFSVALLISDFKEVKEITAVFKKLGANVFFYDDLKTFWHGTIENKPSLSIVDIKLISDGTYLLSEHPHIKNQELMIAFYYAETSTPLLISTHLFSEFSTVKRSDNYEETLKPLIQRIVKRNELNIKMSEIKARENEVLKLKHLLEARDESVEFKLMAKEVCLLLEKNRFGGEFLTAIESTFEAVREIEEFSVLELSMNGQKLVSSLSHSKKFKTIPSIWLGNASVDGIEAFAQNTAGQVALETMAGHLVSLLIKGRSGNVDKMVFVKVSSINFYNHFDWNLLEGYLTGLYNSKEYQHNNGIEFGSMKIKSAFEAMSFVDQYLFGQTAHEAKVEKIDQDTRLVNVDFSSLIDVILKKNTNRFYWNRFLNDFVNKFQMQSNYEFRYFDFGVNHVGFIVKAPVLQNFFEQLKEFSSSFSYWKYFENSDGVLATIIEPKVSMSPLSAYAYLMKTLEKRDPALLSQSKREAQEKLDALFGDSGNSSVSKFTLDM